MKTGKAISILILSTFLIPWSSLSTAAQKQSWSQFIKGVKAEAIAQGIRPEIVHKALKGISAPNRRVLNLDRSQPEKRLTFLKYRNTRADAFRIKLGKRELKKYRPLLEQVSRQYGVSPCFIVSFWGLETSYGRFMGSFPVIKSLTTLAYDNRRATFFRKQLMYALRILNEGHVSLAKFKGEWAGASGHPQFLPSSWFNFAVDHDGDGRKDIWNNLGDAFASISNYLIQNGWKSGEPWAIPVHTPAHFNKEIMTRKVTKSTSEWARMGVTPATGYHFPGKDLKASIVRPYGGPTYMIFNNFNVIMKWNRSIYYAGTVGYMAEKVCKRKL